MKIINLQIEGIKRLSAVEIKPDGSLVTISGKNEHGKSSVLDSIWLALEYAEAIKTNPTPIRNGQDSGRIRLDLGDLIVTRTFTRADNGVGYVTSIKVTNREGLPYPKPQTMLSDLIGHLSFDPLEFARAKPESQYELLKRFVPDVDFAEIAKANTADYNRRTEISRLAREARASVSTIVLPPNLPAEAPDVTALMAKLASAADHNGKINERLAKRAEVAGNEKRMREQANTVAEEAQSLRMKADALETQSQNLLEKAEAEARRLLAAPPLPAPIDTQDLTKQIQEARAIEQLVARAAERNKRIHQAEQLEASAKELTDAIDKRNQAKQEAIAAAKMPVPGLGFGDGVVLLNNVPFVQASKEQRITTSAAIAMAANPKLRILCVHDGSDLDEEHLATLAKMVEDNGYQMWLEKVDSSGQVGFVIEDGALKVGAPANERQDNATLIQNPAAPTTAKGKPKTKDATAKPAAAPAQPQITPDFDL